MIRFLGILNQVQYSKLLLFVRAQNIIVIRATKTRALPPASISQLLLPKKSTEHSTGSGRAFHKRSKQTPSFPYNQMSSPAQQEDEIDFELRDRAHNICREHLGGAWGEIKPDEMVIRPITGGLSNLLFCCSLPESQCAFNGEPPQVLLRLYGEQSRNCDMSLQLHTFKLLSVMKLGPRLYSDFGDGRLEEYLPATSLTCEQVRDRDISAVIARKLAVVHSLDVPMHKSDTWILDRFVEWHRLIREQAEACKQDFELLSESTVEIANKLLNIDFGDEINFLRSSLFDGSCSPIVFSHNDLHQGNILLAEPSKRRPSLDERVILIDFEYCSYNYRAYDIANHLCEWLFEYDTPEYPHFNLCEDKFPSRETQREFIRNYLEGQKLNINREKEGRGRQINRHSEIQGNTATITKSNGSHSVNNNSDCDKLNGYQHSNGNHSNKLTNTNGIAGDKGIDLILEEVRPFFMAVNLVWTLWSIKSAQTSKIKFGYWEHAMARWNLYLKLKEAHLKGVVASTNGH